MARPGVCCVFLVLMCLHVTLAHPNQAGPLVERRSDWLSRRFSDMFRQVRNGTQLAPPSRLPSCLYTD